jgi:predicted Zn-dependent protease with MMP-like domain
MEPNNSNKVFVKPASIRMPTEPIGSIPRPIDLMERAAESVGEDPNLAPLYKAAIRDTLSGLKRRTLRTVVLV